MSIRSKEWLVIAHLIAQEEAFEGTNDIFECLEKYNNTYDEIYDRVKDFMSDTTENE